MNLTKAIKIVVFIAALHLFAWSFFVAKPPALYLVVLSTATIMIWGWVFSLRGGRKRIGMIAGMAFAVVIQQIACHVWRTELPGLWWPLLQFASLQCLVAISCSSSLR